MAGEPSPPVRLVRDFVNTAEPQTGTDLLQPATAAGSLAHLDLVPAGTALGEAELALLVGVREGLRDLLLDHAGHDGRASVRRRLDDLLGTVPLTLRLANGAPTLMAVRDQPAHRAVATVLGAVVSAPPEEWTRLKVCARDSCRWAFFDSSRNRSGRWCSMAGCGNVIKMRRAYRSRSAAQRGSARPTAEAAPTP